MNTILFDLDGTLLPMDYELFLKLYINELGKKMAGYGFETRSMVKALWDGTAAMRDNDGTRTNEECFWQCFAKHLGQKVLDMKPVLEQFYAEEFNLAKPATTENPLVADVLSDLRKKGYKLVLASNPVFPRCAYDSRLAWIGLKTNDFDLFTSYETSRYCKPNTLYYSEILTTIGKKPKECLMVGNDVQEDACASDIGMDFYLVTDCMLNPAGDDVSHFKQGSFVEFAKWANGLPVAK